MPYGPSAARGAWSADGKTLVLEVQTLGNEAAGFCVLALPISARQLQQGHDNARFSQEGDANE